MPLFAGCVCGARLGPRAGWLLLLYVVGELFFLSHKRHTVAGFVLTPEPKTSDCVGALRDLLREAA